jgi:hypothetical protein
MKDHNKKIRNLTESVNNLYENPAIPYSNIPLWDIIRAIPEMIERYYLEKWIEENPDDPYVKIMLFMCNGDLNCIHQMWVEAGKPQPNDDTPPTPPTDIPSPSSPMNPLNRPTL